MQQWRNKLPEKGLLDEKFILSEETELGTWQIHVQEQGGRTEIQEFSVEEYGELLIYICLL